MHQAVVHRFFDAGFMFFAKFHRNFNLNPKIIQSRRILFFVRCHSHPGSFRRQLVLLQILRRIISRARSQRRQHQLRRCHSFVKPALLDWLIAYDAMLPRRNFELHASEMFYQNFHGFVLSCRTHCAAPLPRSTSPGVRSFPTTPDPASLALIPVPGAAATSSLPAKFPVLSPPRLRPVLPYPASHTPHDIPSVAWPSRLATVLLFPATLRAGPPALRCSESRVLLLPIPKAASAAAMRPVSSTASTLAGRSAPATRETIATPAADPNAGTLLAALPPIRLPHLRGFRTPAPFAGTPRLCVRWPALRSSYLIISLVYLAASNLPHIEPQCKS